MTTPRKAGSEDVMGICTALKALVLVCCRSLGGLLALDTLACVACLFALQASNMHQC